MEIAKKKDDQDDQDEIECDVCEGIGTIDELLGGIARSDPEAKCPDCDGSGYYLLRRNND
jgi:DnaJ-class molecular chaperone